MWHVRWHLLCHKISVDICGLGLGWISCCFIPFTYCMSYQKKHPSTLSPHYNFYPLFRTTHVCPLQNGKTEKELLHLLSTMHDLWQGMELLSPFLGPCEAFIRMTILKQRKEKKEGGEWQWLTFFYHHSLWTRTPELFPLVLSQDYNVGITITTPFYRRKNEGVKKFSNFPRVT